MLAYDLKKTVKEISENMSASELGGWQEFYQWRVKAGGKA
jgi:hypothetical protein